MSVKQPVCVFTALGILLAMRRRHVVFCGLPRSTAFFHIKSKAARFKKKVIVHKMCFEFLYNVCLKTFFTLRRTDRGIKNIYICLHVKYPFLVIF
jgi:hypothetical protein